MRERFLSELTAHVLDGGVSRKPQVCAFLSLEFYLHFSQFGGRKWPDGLLHVDGEVLKKSMADLFTQQNRITACLMRNTSHFHFKTFVRVATQRALVREIEWKESSRGAAITHALLWLKRFLIYSTFWSANALIKSITFWITATYKRNGLRSALNVRLTLDSRGD